MTGYSRDEFGAPWADADQNGCDTRDDILRRDLTDLSYESGDRECVVTSGALADPYTATTIDFVVGDGDLVDIDHVVALGNAWVTGADRWDTGHRTTFANDPLNLLAVDASANRQKGDGDTATWLPHNKGYRCRYVARQVSVKAKYGLWVTPPEREAMARVLTTCPGEPQDQGPVASPTRAAPAAVHYDNCDAARAAGAAPLHAGDPGYGPHLDRDGDGSACE
jgi:Protein of unknown function (DUF1524)/Excalibur calcium-binding domain